MPVARVARADSVPQGRPATPASLPTAAAHPAVAWGESAVRGGPGGYGGVAGSGGMGGAALGGAIYNLGTLTLAGGQFETNEALGGAGGGEVNAGLNYGGVGGLGGPGGQGGQAGNIVLVSGCKKIGKAGSGGPGGGGGASGWSGQGGEGGPGGTGGTAQGGAIWDGASLSLEGTQFGASTAGGNAAQGGAGGLGGNGGSAAAGLQSNGGAGSPGGCVGGYENLQGVSVMDCYVWEAFLFGSPGRSGRNGLKSFGAAGGVGGQGGDGGGAQGGAIYATKTAALQESGPIFPGQTGLNAAAGGSAGQGGLGGYSKCNVYMNPSGPDSLECTGPNIYAKRAQSNGNGSAGSGTGVNVYQEGQQSSLGITTAALPGGVAGDWYSTMLQATGGVGPYQWSWQGKIPPGLTLDATYGSIYTTAATVAGMYFFTATVTDAMGETASEVLSIDIVPTAAGAIMGGNVFSGSSDATNSTANGSATAGGPNTLTPDTTATAFGGVGTVAVSDYTVDPVGAPSFQSSGQYFDIAVSTPSAGGFQSMEVSECGMSSGDTVEWSPDGTTWQPVDPQSYDAGCVTLGPLTAYTTPSIYQLMGTVFGVAAPAVGLAGGDQLAFSSQTIAPQGSLNPGDTAVTDVTAESAQGAPIPGATIYLSLANGAVGSAVAEGVALAGTPQAFTADSQGQVAVTYTAPLDLPESGLDTVVAQSDEGAMAAVTASASYNFAAPVLVPASISLTASPTEVAADGSATLSGFVYDAQGNAVQNAYVDISASSGNLTAYEVTTLSDGSYSVTWLPPLDGGSATLTATVVGSPGVTYSANVTALAPARPPAPIPTGPTAVGALGGTLSTADGSFQMIVAPGLLGAGEELHLAQRGAPATGLPTGMQVAGGEWVLSGNAPAQRVAATITYASSGLGGLSADRLAVYAQGSNGNWMYLPTQVNPASDTVSVWVDGPETLLLLVSTSPTPDVAADYWASPYIDTLLAAGVLQGTSTGAIEPGAVVTRAEFVKMLVLATIGIAGAETATPFRDVAPSDWYAPYVAAALQAGIAQGTSATSFSPAAPVSREQMATLLARALKLSPSALPPKFRDVGQISSWAVQSVASIAAAGYMSGFPDGRFQPLAPTTRAQAAKVLALVIARLAP